jgi:checkpoint serine/threonine-protein kinase
LRVYHEDQKVLNEQTGRWNVVFTNLRMVYPTSESRGPVELSFEELRAKHRGWSDRDWTAARRNQREDPRKALAVASVDSGLKSKPLPLAPKEPSEKPMKLKTVPLKGSVDDDVENDENVPPSQAEIDRAKIARKARREERANRTRKIKVMEVREVRAETQTSRVLTKGTKGMLLTVYSSNKP